ncbi:hypothetical protein [Kordia sp.]|uniref:hypothetical protein n=1 Tax=Kordia sp. TaxID=1965332 RepID=UPI003D2C527C
MKRFALNKISIAKLANLQTIRGGLATPNRTSVAILECAQPTATDCVTDDCATGGTMPCTLTSSASELTSDPVGSDTTSL